MHPVKLVSDRMERRQQQRRLQCERRAGPFERWREWPVRAMKSGARVVVEVAALRMGNGGGADDTAREQQANARGVAPSAADRKSVV